MSIYLILFWSFLNVYIIYIVSIKCLFLLCYLPNAIVIKILAKHTINMWTFIFEIQGRWFASQIEKPGEAFLWNLTSDKNLCFISPVWQNGNTTQICKKKNNKVIKKKWYKLLKGKSNKQKWLMLIVKIFYCILWFISTVFTLT